MNADDIKVCRIRAGRIRQEELLRRLNADRPEDAPEMVISDVMALERGRVPVSQSMEARIRQACRADWAEQEVAR